MMPAHAQAREAMASPSVCVGDAFHEAPCGGYPADGYPATGYPWAVWPWAGYPWTA
jgi:hypothetical protein